MLAYWLGNPILNPATIVFMGFVLGWGWAALRIAVGVLLVAAGAWLGDRYRGSAQVPDEAEEAFLAAQAPEPQGSLMGRWVKSAWRMALGLLPEYLLILLALGAARAFLFPHMTPAIGSSLLLFVGMAIAGTLFVIPTAGEVPILQTLLGYGLGPASAGALMITLPAVSLPSLFMVGSAMPKRLMVQVAVLVALFGLITGAIALGLHL